MAFGLIQSSAPSVEPVVVAEIKSHCNVDHDDDDLLLSNLIKAARELAETRTRRQFITATWKMYLDEWPGTIILPRPPLQSVTSIKYYDTDGNQQTWSSANYDVFTNKEPGIVQLAYGCSYPVLRARSEAIEVIYKAGYGDAATSVPQGLKQAIMMLVAHWYENREASISGAAIGTVPMAIDSLLMQHHCGYVW